MRRRRPLRWRAPPRGARCARRAGTPARAGTWAARARAPRPSAPRRGTRRRPGSAPSRRSTRAPAPRSGPSPSRTTAGRGDGGTLRPEPYDVLAGVDDADRAAELVGQGARRRPGPPSGASRRRRPRWRAARRASRPARTTRRPARGRQAPPSWWRAAPPPAGRAGSGSGGASSRVRPPARDRAGRDRAASRVSATTQRSPAASSGSASEAGCHGTATSASAGAVSSAKPPWPSGTSRPTRWGVPPSRAARAVAGPSGRVAAGPPAAVETASTTVRQPVQRHRWAPRVRSISAGPVRPRSRSHAARTTMPGVQNPHWEPPVATNAAARVSRRAGSRPSRVVTARPATRVAGVTHATAGVTVDEDGAAAALPLGCAAVLHRSQAEPLPQHRQQRLLGCGVDRHRRAVAGELDPICIGHGATAG